jgi:hypothetical protein
MIQSILGNFLQPAAVGVGGPSVTPSPVPTIIPAQVNTAPTGTVAPQAVQPNQGADIMKLIQTMFNSGANTVNVPTMSI